MRASPGAQEPTDENGSDPFVRPRLLRDAFADEGSRRFGTFLCADQRGSTRAKLTKSEATWVSECAKVYDTIISIATRWSPTVSHTFLGDGVMLFYDGDDHANVAVQSAVEIQEALAVLSRPSDGAVVGVIDVDVAIAVASGTAYWFDTNGGLNAIGTCVDRAARLCGAATARAIFMDDETTSVMNLKRITSRYGEASFRTPTQYAGEKQHVALKGITEKVGYHEILWERQRFGVRSEMASPDGDPQGTPPVAPVRTIGSAASVTATGSRRTTSEKVIGKVKFWDESKNYGFITGSGESNEDFFFAPDLMAYEDDLTKIEKGTEVAFVALPASPGGRNRRAGAVLVVGQYADGELVAVPTEQRPYGWIEVKDGLGHSRAVYAPAQALVGFKRGKTVSFTLGINHRGAVALDVVATTEEDAA